MKNENLTMLEREMKLREMVAEMRRQGMSEEEIRATLTVENNERCNPPLSENEPKEIIEDTIKGLPLLRLYEMADVGAWECDPLVWKVEPLITAGSIGFLSGLPKAGKSMLALDLALHLACAHADATERAWLGRFKVAPSRVLYITGEDTARRIEERIIEMRESYGMREIAEKSVCFLIGECFSLTDSRHANWLCRTVRHYGIDFLILDGFHKMIASLDENSARDMAKVTDILQGIRRDLKTTVLVLERTRKGTGSREGGKPNPLDICGSARKFAGADFTIKIARGKRGQIEVYAECKDSEECPHFCVEVSPKGSGKPKLRWGGDIPERMDAEEIREQSLQRICEALGNGSLSRKEIVEKTGLGKTAVSFCLSALVSGGKG
jgi:hypothetical protein